MEQSIKQFYTRRLGLTIPVNEAYEEFIKEEGTNISKTDFIIRTHYSGLARKKQVSGKKYFVVNTTLPSEESLF